ncbi:MAG: hypothetical protein PHH85_13435 [Candidatus Methanoperedens sp.]|nr:hypothetical protein [Candidatus Methanoperedens sp.]
MNSSLHPKISMMLGIFDGQVMKINSMNLLDEKKLPDQEVYESEDIDWNMFERVPGVVRDGIYCNLLQNKVRMCNFVSCTYYKKCHKKE